MLFGLIEFTGGGVVCVEIGLCKEEGREFISEFGGAVGEGFNDLLVVGVAVEEMIFVIVFFGLSDNGDELFELFTHLGGGVIDEEHADEGGLIRVFEY